MVKVVFLGTPAFAVPTLERLLTSRHAVAAVVTQPDRPRGRGQRVSESSIKQVAKVHGVPVFQPHKMKDPSFVGALTKLGPDLGVVAAYGKILPDQLLTLPRLGMINVHASLLPKYRGAAPIHPGGDGRRDRDRNHDHPARPRNGRRPHAQAGGTPDRSGTDQRCPGA